MTEAGAHDGSRMGIDRMQRIGFDRIIDTDLPIRGTLAASHDAETARGTRDETLRDIVVTLKPPIAVPAADRPIWSLSGDTLHFAAPGIADYRCGAMLIDVTPVAGAAPDMVEALLVATALPATLWLQGDFMLHAAAVIPHDRNDAALAIAGPSGSGKSRLAAAFLSRNARLVADDSIAVRPNGRRDATWPRCAGLAGGYHLAADDPGGGQGETGDRPFHPVTEDRARRTARLAAVVVLADIRTATRLAAVDAIAALLANRHRASVPRRCGLEHRALRDATLLARSIPVYTWPRDDADALLDDDIRRAIMRNGGE